MDGEVGLETDLDFEQALFQVGEACLPGDLPESGRVAAVPPSTSGRMRPGGW
jgi:hypothetical protein